jgi:hypothetical protein
MYGHLIYFLIIWYILVYICYIIPILVYSIEKNMATVQMSLQKIAQNVAQPIFGKWPNTYVTYILCR